MVIIMSLIVDNSAVPNAPGPLQKYSLIMMLWNVVITSITVHIYTMNLTVTDSLKQKNVVYALYEAYKIRKQ